MLVTVAAEDNRSLPSLRLEAIGVELGLLFPHLRVDQGLLRLDHRQRPTIVAPQHIVDVADLRARGHPLHLVLDIAPFNEFSPARFGQQRIDLVAARVRLRPVVRLDRDRLSGLLRRRHLSPQLGQLSLKFLGSPSRLLQPLTGPRTLLDLAPQPFLKVLTLLQRGLCSPAGVHQSVRLEAQRRVRLRRTAVRECQPETELEQRRDNLDRLQLRRGLDSCTARSPANWIFLAKSKIRPLANALNAGSLRYAPSRSSYGSGSPRSC